MKTNLPFLFFLSSLCSIRFEGFSQQNEWTWMKGDSVSSTSGIYGTQGIPDSLNTPPALYEPCEWLDHQGKFWIFGGSELTTNYGALWTFDPLSSMWTWMSGSSSPNQNGIYGVKGTPASTNLPGARFCAASWIDSSGNFWMYGGYGRASTNAVGGLSDLWNYNLLTNEWTWVNGSNIVDAAAVFGTQGVSDTINTPGGRLETAATWVDDSNNLWLFGGILCCSASGNMNDVWKYNVSTNQWTWMKGSNVPNQPSVHGTKGVPAASNTPGGRRIYSHWKDEQNKFWIFGGQESTNDCFGDLWRYDPATNEWTWMSGSNLPNTLGNYGTQCAFDSINAPPSRMENRYYFTDSCSNFWMFGGTNTASNTYRNDVWLYDPALNEWKWISGSSSTNQDGAYGTKNVPSVTNHPGARYGGVAWQGPNETLWLFGGNGYDGDLNIGELNDLWRFDPDSACIICETENLSLTSFSALDTTICEKFCVDFVDASTSNPLAWEWIFSGGTPSSSIDQNPLQICYQIPGTYDVTLITTTSSGNDTLTLSDYITVYPTPAIPTITQNGYTLTSSPAASYQWQFNNIDIASATNQSYTATQTGFYTVTIADSNGCTNAATVYVLITGMMDLINDDDFSIYPNPSSGTIFVVWVSGLKRGEIIINVLNTLGQEIYSAREMVSDHLVKEIDLSTIAEGIYFIEIKNEDTSARKKIVLTK